MKQQLVFVKIGGSYITDKSKPYSIHSKKIKKLVYDLGKVVQDNPNIQFIFGNGAGSFAHVPAKKYKIQEGITDMNGYLGMCHVAYDAQMLNLILSKEFLNNNVSVFPVHPSSCMTLLDKSVKSIYSQSIRALVNANIIPFIHGDIVVDEIRGAYIYSTEALFDVLIQEFETAYDISHIIHLTVVEGVFGPNNKVIPEIDSNNISEVEQYLINAEGYDVTGGMAHKIHQSLEYSKKGIQTYIIQGNQANTISKILSNIQIETGTKIS
ncbi:MAG: isopentenyl phosphate kinase [Candidatus Roizmanbacteria bacterium]